MSAKKISFISEGMSKELSRKLASINIDGVRYINTDEFLDESESIEPEMRNSITIYMSENN